MNHSFHSRAQANGSALIVVIVLIFMMGILTTSMLRYSAGERRGNERNRIILRSKNMAENVTMYSAEQISTKLHRLKTVSSMKFSSGANQLYLPPSSVLTTKYSAPSDVETYAGIVSSSPLALITDTTNSNYGLQALTGNVPIIAKSTMTHPALGAITTYAEQDMQISEVPLFQFAIFYDPDLEFAPGANMTISGPVNTNGNFIARDQTGFSNTVAFKARVTAVGGFFANTGYKGTTYNEYDQADTGPGGTGPLNFQNTSGTVTNINNGSIWRDHLYGGSTVTTTSVANFKTFATSAYAGNFQTSAMGVAPLTLPGIDTTLANSGRNVINRPDNTNDTADVIAAATQFSRKAGLYIIVNPTAQTRNGHLPYEPAHSPSSDATVSMRAYSYRCFLNTTNTDQSHTISEVILPGQPSYGALNANVNNLPNAYRVNTSVYSNQVLRIPQGGGVDLADTGYNKGAAAPTMSNFGDAYFYDMRRADYSTGHPFSRSTNAFAPRPITKIDFDMTRFSMALNRTYNAATTSSVFFPDRPNSVTWASSIFNAAGAVASYGLGMGSTYNLFGAQVTVPAVETSTAGVNAPAAIKIGATSQTGAAATAGYAGRIKVQDTTGTNPATATWTDRYNSSADESATTYTPSTGITFLKVILYAAGGTTNPLDTQIVPVVADTTTTTVAALTNDNMIIPSQASGVTVAGNFTTQSISTEMRVYVGGVDDTKNWTYGALPSSGNGITVNGSTSTSTAVAGTGTAKNVFTVSAMTSTTTGSVVITATKGASTVSKTFSLAKESNVTGAGTNQTGYWLSVTSLPGPDPFQIYFAPSNPADPLIQTNPASFAVAPTDLYNSGSGPWYDGIAIYIESVDAEVVTYTAGGKDRMDSGVRLWNGRVTTPSFITSGTTGFSFCTNDAVYIVGHFNADGTINSTTTATGNGGYSALYPDSANEYLASVMGDAITIMSQPVFNSSYYQTNGWTDSLSATRGRSTNYSTSWATTNPGSGNSTDGLSANVTPSTMPNLGNTSSPGAAAAVSVQFGPAAAGTEVSAALLSGIVPTTSHQNSGGAHNFPRLLENWSARPLYIRGSMVAMFASSIATEPWSIRIYSGAERDWGLHYNLTNAHHDLPLEPMVVSATRLAYRELTAAQYAAMKATIQALPTP